MAECSPQKKDIIIYLAALGRNYTQIGEQTGATYTTIKELLNLERSQFEINQIRYKLYGRDVQKTFRDLVPQAQELTARILEDESLKMDTRLSAAKEIFDRALGKPKQTIEHQGSIINKLFDKLDKASAKEIMDITPGPIELPQPLENEPVEAKIESLPEPSDEIDAWAKNNL